MVFIEEVMSVPTFDDQARSMWDGSETDLLEPFGLSLAVTAGDVIIRHGNRINCQDVDWVLFEQSIGCSVDILESDVVLVLFLQRDLGASGMEDPFHLGPCESSRWVSPPEGA